MSGIGKIFVVLNLVFSLVILGAAAAYLSKADDWRGMYNNLKEQAAKEKSDLEQQLSDMTASRDNYKADSETKQNKIEDLEMALQEKENELKSEKLSNQQLRDDVTKINTSLDNLRSTINDLTARNNDLVDGNTKLRKEALDAKALQQKAEEDLARVQGELAKAKDQIAALETRVTELGKEKEHLANLLEVAKQQGFDISSLVAMPEIPAFIQEVNNEEGFVILSVGSDDQVKKGYVFQVYRGDKYLGEVVVDDLYPDHCAARIKFRVNGVQFQINDKATTRL